MSTSSTAAAPHHHHHHQYHHHHYPGYRQHVYHQRPNSPFSTTNAAAAAEAARLGSAYVHAVHSPPSTSSTTTCATSTTLPFAPSSKFVPVGSTPVTMTSHSTASHSIPTSSHDIAKRKPDWGEFYKNGIPKEVIVIDDSPLPESVNNSTTQMQPAGKKRKTGVDSNYNVDSYDRPSYSINPQTYGESSSTTSLSTDRTASLHTTAPTSLGSSSGMSNGKHYEDADVGQKRKRVTTRKSTRDTQKLKDLATYGDAFMSYVPPPHPPIKAKDVPVPVVRDVSPPFLCYWKDLLM